MRNDQPGNDATPHRMSAAGDALASVSVERNGKVAIVRLAGDFDLYARELLANNLGILLGDDRVRRVDVDASGVCFVDSAGLKALIALKGAAEALGITFQIVAASPHLGRILHLTGLDDIIAFSPAPPSS